MPLSDTVAPSAGEGADMLAESGRGATSGSISVHDSSDLIAQANPGASYRALKDEIDSAVARVLSSGTYILGQEVAKFETEFAAWQRARHAIGCANGTDALALVLRGLGIGEGSAVATVSHTAVATVAAVEMAGAAPVLVDIEPDYFTMDPADLLKLLESPAPGLPPIRAAILVHLYGQPADLDSILAICARFGVTVIEDCSQAHGALYRGRRVGGFGHAAAFSLYPTKNLGAFGDAGVVTTDDDALAARLAALRQYGWRARVSEAIGVNSRLDEMQAAILRVKLRHLDQQNARRGAIARRYDAALGKGELKPPARRPESAHVFHQYVLQWRDRDDLQARLKARGVGTGIHYPAPVHLQPAYLGRTLLAPSACVVTEAAAREVLSLPMYPELTDAQVARICAALRECG
jgi:dTDP-4-amino-4,6-dideoxygalactose transaminase